MKLNKKKALPLFSGNASFSVGRFGGLFVLLGTVFKLVKFLVDVTFCFLHNVLLILLDEVQKLAVVGNDQRAACHTYGKT